jgi:hypothetical protein
VRLRSVSVTASSVGRVYFPPAIGHKIGVREEHLIGSVDAFLKPRKLEARAGGSEERLFF